MLQSNNQGSTFTNSLQQQLDFVKSEQFATDFKAVIRARHLAYVEHHSCLHFKQIQAAMAHPQDADFTDRWELDSFKEAYDNFNLGLKQDEQHQYHLCAFDNYYGDNEFSVHITGQNKKLQYTILTDVANRQYLIDSQIKPMRQKLLKKLTNVTRVITDEGHLTYQMYQQGICQLTDLPLSEITPNSIHFRSVELTTEEVLYILQQMVHAFKTITADDILYVTPSLFAVVADAVKTKNDAITNEGLNLLKVIATNIKAIMSRSNTDNYDDIINELIQIAQLLIASTGAAKITQVPVKLQRTFYHTVMQIIATMTNLTKESNFLDSRVDQAISARLERLLAAQSELDDVVVDDITVIPEYGATSAYDLESTFPETIGHNVFSDHYDISHHQTINIYLNDLVISTGYNKWLMKFMKLPLNIHLYVTANWQHAATQYIHSAQAALAVCSTKVESSDSFVLTKSTEQLTELMQMAEVIDNDQFENLPHQIVILDR